MLNRCLNHIPSCCKRVRSSLGPSLAPTTSKTSSYLSPNQPSRFITRTTAWSPHLSSLLAPGEEPETQQEVREVRFIGLRPLRTSTGDQDQNYDLDRFSHSWCRDYAAIHVRRRTVEIWEPGELKTWILSTERMRMHRTAAICDRLERPQQYGKRKNRIIEWRNFLLVALQHFPECALMILDIAVSNYSLRVPKYMVTDSLTHLTQIYLKECKPPPSLTTQIYLKGSRTPSSWTIDTIHRIACNLATRSLSPHRRTSHIPQLTIFFLVYYCDNLQAMSLYKFLCEVNNDFSLPVLLRFLERFIEMGNIPLSLEVLRNITSGFSLSTTYRQKYYARLLRLLIRCKHGNYDSKTLYGMQKHVLAQILQMGIRPDIKAYTAIIQNAVEAKEYRSAMQLYEVARGIGLKPTWVTYVVLLEASMQKLDSEILDMVVRDAEADGTLFGNEGLIFKLLRVKIKLKQNTTEPFLFDAVLPTYQKYCDLRPIQELGLCEPDVDPPGTSIHPLISPSSRVLTLMLAIYIRQHCYSNELLNLYQRYYRFAEERHPMIAAIEETNHVSNAFIFAFGQRKETLPMGIDIVRKMLENAADSKTTDLTTSMPFNFAAPTVETWSILAMVHARHGQKKAAEKILEMMRERGLQPDRVTWNGLISGYSALQRIHDAVGTVKMMEADGFQIDSFTLKGLGRFGSRNRLLQVLTEEFGMDDVEGDQDPANADANGE